jgi:autotransporter-associated beta strand protein
MNVSFLSADLVAKRQSAGVRWTCFAAITLLLVFGASDDVSAQFTFASDNASSSAYGDGWGSGDNGGSGFTAWNINYGASTGTFIGNPANNGMGTSGIGTTAFGLYATGNAYVDAFRGGFTMNVGDTLSYYWAMNFDAGSGSKGVDFRVNDDGVYNINNNGSSTITAGGSTANANYGTTPMLVTLTRSSGSQYSFSMTSRSGGSTYATTFNQSGAINNLKIYIGNQNDGAGQKNIYFNNFSLTNSGVYYNTQTESRALTGNGSLVVSNNSTLTLTSNGNTFSGGTTIQSGSTLSVGNGGGTGDLSGNVANSGTLTFNRTGTLDVGGVVSGTGALTKSGTGQINLQGNNVYEGTTTVSEGTLEIQNANALGSTAAGTSVSSGATLKMWSNTGFTTAAEALTINGSGVGGSGGALRNEGGNNTFAGAITLGSASRIDANTGTTLTLDVASGSAITGTHNLTLGGAGNIIVADAIATSTGTLTKDGAGTLTFSGNDANTYTGLTTVSGGTLQLNKTAGVNAIAGAVTVNSGAVLLLSASNQVDSGAGDTVTLSGGTIQRASGVSEVFGNLNVTSASTINFGGTAQSNFLEFGSVTGGSNLTVSNFLIGNQFKFAAANLDAGTAIANSFSYLTSDTRSYSFSGSTFTITAIPEPSTYVAAAGLLAMFLWPARRRVIKDVKSILGLRPTGRERIEAYRKA